MSREVISEQLSVRKGATKSSKQDRNPGRAIIGIYDTVLTTEVRLPLTALHHQMANFLGLSVSQIAPNAWRIFIGSKILWGRLSGGNHQLTLDEFF